MITTTESDTPAHQASQSTTTPVFLPMLSRTPRAFHGGVVRTLTIRQSTSKATLVLTTGQTRRCSTMCAYLWKIRQVRVPRTTRCSLRRGSCFNKKPEGHLPVDTARKIPKTSYDKKFSSPTKLSPASPKTLFRWFDRATRTRPKSGRSTSLYRG